MSTGTRKADRIPAQPFLTWVDTQRPFSDRITPTDERAINRARKLGFIDSYGADRIATRLGRPEMVRLLYGDLGVAA